ncbi:helix-turn-helix transcriptional regulator [Arenibaculum sp.]|uniref:helix-turn-helix transcriptional regulator n=1 Tax=Arenibaculum sp. TaxID=2865862 RepID=UPI002E118038|nr:helix-turn-helix transcriptional regulator [Arenibaculum sp.]
MTAPVPELMNTREVARYVRLKERKIYDLVSRGLIPCTRVGGKWLFPKGRIDAWLAGQAEAPSRPAPPPVIAGSHDPFLEWCADESGCGLALLGGGSLDGLDRLARGEAVAAGVHVLDPATGDYNTAAIEDRLGGREVVAIEWAEREQGLVLPAGNPLAVAGLRDLAARGARLALRQPGSGARILLDHLLRLEGLAPDAFEGAGRTVRTETEVGFAVLEGRADAGLAIRAVASRLRLDFLPLHRERFDLVMRRRDYFEPAIQALLGFARTAAAAQRAAELDGYDARRLGAVRYNAPDRDAAPPPQNVLAPLTGRRTA